MKPHSESSSPAASANPQPERNSRAPAANSKSDGRPRRLDDAKRQIVCAMVSSGCGLRDAARYVQCSVRTIRREAERNPEFGDQLRRSEVHAKLNPLRAMQHAISTHWRAAAWFLERAFPERFARPGRGAFGAREARRLLDEVLRIVSSEVDPMHSDRVEKRVKATFEYHVRRACDPDRSSRDLRHAMAYFEDKEHYGDPLVRFGLATPEPPWRTKAEPAASSATPPSPNSHKPQNASTSVEPDPVMMARLRELMAKNESRTEPPVAEQPAARTNF